MVPNLGVRFGEPSKDVWTDASLATVRAVAESSLRSFENCRVAGRATHAAVLLTFGAHGELLMTGALGDGDLGASRCVGTRFAEAADHVNFGSTRFGTVTLTADLDAM